jgi:hypothetical protein
MMAGVLAAVDWQTAATVEVWPLPGPGNVVTTFLADGNSCLADTGRAS